MSTPRISVIIPTRGEDAPAARAAVLAQGLDDAEVIVVGGALGPSAGRNQGVRQASGDTLVFLDDDVTIEPADALRRLIREIDERADAGAIGATVGLPADASPFQRRLAAQVPRIEFSAGETDRPARGLPTGACFVVRRRAFDIVGGFDERLPSGEDVGFFKSLEEVGLPTYVDPRVRVLHYPPGGWVALWRKFSWYGRGQLRLARHHARGGHRRWVQWPPLSIAYVLARLAVAPLHCLLDWRDGAPRPGWRPLRAWASAAAAVGFMLESFRRARSRS